jgi:mycothiol synthase
VPRTSSNSTVRRQLGVAFTDALPTPSDVAELAAACVDADAVAPFSSSILENLERPLGVSTRVSAGASPDTDYLTGYLDGKLVACAVLPQLDPAELAIAPQVRRRGLGSALLDTVLRRTSRVWAHGNLLAARRLAGSYELNAVRTLLQYRRSLLTLPNSAPLPPGVRVRTFRPGVDDATLLAVNARAFSWHPEQGRFDQAALDLDKAQEWFDPDGFFLAEASSGKLLGFHWTKVHRADPTPGNGPRTPIGEVYVLGVDPLSPIRGLGAPLTRAGLEYLQAQGLATVMLYTEADNDRAVALYERLGFSLHLTDVVYATKDKPVRADQTSTAVRL